MVGNRDTKGKRVAIVFPVCVCVFFAPPRLGGGVKGKLLQVAARSGSSLFFCFSYYDSSRGGGGGCGDGGREKGEGC